MVSRARMWFLRAMPQLPSTPREEILSMTTIWRYFRKYS